MNTTMLFSHFLTVTSRMGRRDYANRLANHQRELEATRVAFLETQTEKDLEDLLARCTTIVSEAIAWEAKNWRVIRREQKQALRGDPFLRQIGRMSGPGLGHKPVRTRGGVPVLPETLFWFEEAQKLFPDALIVVATRRALQRPE